MATIQEVAEQAGVSVATVSNVLNGRNKNVWRSTQRRAEAIRKIADRLGYRPNAAARAVAAGKHQCIALVLATRSERSYLPADLLAGVHSVTNAQKQNLVLVRLPDESLTDPRYMPRVLEESFSDGLLVDYTHAAPERMKEIISEYRIPAIWVNSKQSADCIVPDDVAAAREATRHLLSLGHRRIAYADYSHGPAFPSAHHSTDDRRLGYEQTMREAGLEPWLVHAASGYDVRSPERIAFSRHLLSQPDRPSAIIGYSTDEIQPLFVAAMTLGLSIPQDLSLACFAGLVVKWFGPHITTWLVPEFEVGRRSTEMLLAKIADKTKSFDPVQVPFAFYPGQSCGPMYA
jgi:DNA-binding LacI/PurR family transcriptional regulator